MADEALRKVAIALDFLLAELARKDEALQRLGSTEGFCGALDAKAATRDALWNELRARGEYARAALGEQP